MVEEAIAPAKYSRKFVVAALAESPLSARNRQIDVRSILSNVKA
jgi:hypothetical protein